MSLIKRDINELRYNAIWLLPKDHNPNYYINLIKNFKALAIGMKRTHLLRELEYITYQKIEKPMGCKVTQVLMTYKNLPYLNSFTRSKNPAYTGINVMKYTIQEWLDDIETWIMQKTIELEPSIRFTLPSKQFM